MVQLAEISWAEAGEQLKHVDVALLPVGSTEQHGPHNPLGTDHLVAAALSRAVGDKTGALVLQTIPVGVSEHHRQFHGTLWVPPRVFREYVKSVAQAIASHGVRKLIIVNGHGGNTSALIEVAGELRREHDVFAMVLMAFPPAMMGQRSGHAGVGETSINLYLHGNLVKMEKAVDTKQKEMLGNLKIKGMSKIGPADFPWDTIDLTDTGVLGSAGEVIESRAATYEKGKQLMEPFIDEVAAFVEDLKAADVSGLLSKAHK